MSRVSVPEKPIPSRHLDQWEKEREYKRHRAAIRNAKAQVDSRRGKRSRKSRAKKHVRAKKEFEDNNVDLANEMFVERVNTAKSFKHSTLLEEANLSSRGKGDSKELKMSKMTVVVPKFGRPEKYSYDGVSDSYAFEEEEEYTEASEAASEHRVPRRNWQNEDDGEYEYEYEEVEDEEGRPQRQRVRKSVTGSEAGDRGTDSHASGAGRRGRGGAAKSGAGGESPGESGDVEAHEGGDEAAEGSIRAAEVGEAKKESGDDAKGGASAVDEEKAQKKASKCCILL